MDILDRYVLRVHHRRYPDGDGVRNTPDRRQPDAVAEADPHPG